jgi:hypothetical protein
MRKHIYLITVLIAIVMIYFYLYGAETFVNQKDPLASLHNQQRTNQLAINTNLQQNRVTEIGIPVAEGRALTAMSTMALNSFKQHPNSEGGISMSMPGNYTSGEGFLDTPLSIPVSDETSMLGIEKYCKDKDVTTDPFGDPEFMENCGVCLGAGAFTGTPTTPFDGPKGVLVYKADKDRANARKTANNYKYARAMPSLGRAVCRGATSQEDDSAPPTLALDSDMYRDAMGRMRCQKNQEYVPDKSCGKCMADTTIWSYIQHPPNGTVQNLELQLVGNGKVTITVKGAATPVLNTVLSNTPLIVDLSKYTGAPSSSAVQEGDPFVVSVQAATAAAPFIGGLLKGTNADGTIYLQEFYNTVLRDDINSGNSVRTGTPSVFVSGLNVRVKRLVPKYPLPTTAEKMRLVCEIPFTFIDYSDGNNNIAYYDCKKGPYVTTTAHENKLFQDECSGQAPGQYSEDCKRKIVLDAGCSSAGSWWTTGLPADAISGTVAQIKAWIQGRQGAANTDPAVAEGCYGITSVATPCDGVGPGNPPSNACLAYLYKNTSEQSANIGKAYDTTN